MTPTITLPRYQGKQGQQTFRNPSSIEEMAAHCARHSHIWFRSLLGDARRAKVNGAVRRWKTNANRIEVPLKYGLHEYDTFNVNDINRVLIPISEA
jgi:hypothetical protein